MEHRWIIVRERQAGLRAEADAERLAQLARAAAAERPAAERSAASPVVTRPRARRRLVTAGTSLSAETTLTTCDCPEA